MSGSFDIIVAGLGAMGSAAAAHLAGRGSRVLGLDSFSPPHAQGSSHGQSRIIREAYFEDPRYVPLVQRAYELWAELEHQSGRTLFQQTGGLMIGQPGSVVVEGARHSAETHGLPFELLTGEDIALRFPALRPGAGMMGVWEPRAGVLFPEACIVAHLELAHRAGAALRMDEPMLSWRADGDGVRVTTGRSEYHAARLVLAAGAWMPGLLAELALPLNVERQTLFWFEPGAHPGRFAPDRCPVHIWEYEPGRMFYGFPDLGEGVKLARHHEGALVHPDQVDRRVQPAEAADVRRILRRYLPDADGPLRATAVCMYTNTPDEHFVIDLHPAHPQVVLASACSGHGFKFSSAIGEVLADLALDGRSRFDLDLFSCTRTALRSPSETLS